MHKWGIVFLDRRGLIADSLKDWADSKPGILILDLLQSTVRTAEMHVHATKSADGSFLTTGDLVDFYVSSHKDRNKMICVTDGDPMLAGPMHDAFVTYAPENIMVTHFTARLIDRYIRHGFSEPIGLLSEVVIDAFDRLYGEFSYPTDEMTLDQKRLRIKEIKDLIDFKEPKNRMVS